MKAAYLMAPILLAAAAAAPAQPGAGELDRHRALWERAAVADYVYAYRKHCDCYRDTPPATVVTVERGDIARVFHVHDDSDREVPAREGSLDLYWTIAGLFELIESARTRDADIRVRYDADLGFPRSIYIDYDADFVGDELDIRVESFRAAGR